MNEQGSHYHSGVIHLRLYLEIKVSRFFWLSEYTRTAYTSSLPDQHPLYPCEQQSHAFCTTLLFDSIRLSAPGLLDNNMIPRLSLKTPYRKEGAMHPQSLLLIHEY